MLIASRGLDSTAMASVFPKAYAPTYIPPSSSTHHPCCASPAANLSFGKGDRPLRSPVSSSSGYHGISQWRSFPSPRSLPFCPCLGQNKISSFEVQGILVQAQASASESHKHSTATVPDPPEGYLVPDGADGIAGLGSNESVKESGDVAERASKEQNERLRSAIVQDDSALKLVPPPGHGQRIYELDPDLKKHREHLEYRFNRYRKKRESIDKYEGGLEAFSRGYEKMGFNRSSDGITYREWAPGAKSASLVGDFNNWNPNADVMAKNEFGVWEIFLPNNVDGSPAIPHGSRIKIHMHTPSGVKDCIPAWIKFAVQAPGAVSYNGIYYDPPQEEKYEFKHPRPKRPSSLRIYEAHVGMSSPEGKINSYAGFRDDVLPRIKKLGYNAVQLMAIQEHAYYASFGYHVTNYFAVSSRCGTPDDLKSLIDRAHELGIVVLMDIVHSHASKNVLDGLNLFDGTDSQYFHSGARGYHWMWDSRIFNYGEWEVS